MSSIADVEMRPRVILLDQGRLKIGSEMVEDLSILLAGDLTPTPLKGIDDCQILHQRHGSTEDRGHG